MKVVYLGLFIQILLNCSIQGNSPSGGLPLPLLPSVWAQHCRQTITSAAATAQPAPALPFSPFLKCALGDTRAFDCGICHPTDCQGWFGSSGCLNRCPCSPSWLHVSLLMLQLSWRGWLSPYERGQVSGQLLYSPVRASKQALKCAVVSTAI